jgi:hypothetical protein
MFRISRDGSDHIIDVDARDQIEPSIRAERPGRFHIDEISATPLPSGHTARRWGIGIKRDDGTTTLDRDAWDA